ncbi:response regulator transcription factor [soil metagenome]
MRILLVEDDIAIAAAVVRGLDAEGHVTELATDGITGLWMAQESEFDVVVLDIMLPGMNGYEVCKQLRASNATVPILMLTAKDGEFDEADALDLGADDYLTKPFSFVVLVARIRALLRRTSTDRSPVLGTGTLRLDVSRARCWRGDVEIELTPRELALAEFLLRRKGHVVSRSTIAEHVWNAELDIDSNVVEVYIGYLRRKLDRPFGTRDIVTVRGLGYRLNDSPLADAAKP